MPTPHGLSVTNRAASGAACAELFELTYDNVFYHLSNLTANVLSNLIQTFCWKMTAVP